MRLKQHIYEILVMMMVNLELVYNHTFGNLEIQRYDEQGPSYKLYAIIQ